MHLNDCELESNFFAHPDLRLTVKYFKNEQREYSEYIQISDIQIQNIQRKWQNWLNTRVWKKKISKSRLTKLTIEFNDTKKSVDTKLTIEFKWHKEICGYYFNLNTTMTVLHLI